MKLDFSFSRNKERVERMLARRQLDARLRQLGRTVSEISSVKQGVKPVILFNASTRLSGVSLNAAYEMLAGWALQLAGVPVIHFVCQKGLSHCVLGTDRSNPETHPPCDSCMRQSAVNTSGARVFPLEPIDNLALRDILEMSSLEDLMAFHYEGIPLAELALPALRWIMRQHRLEDDQRTRYLLKEYILSAYRVVTQFSKVLDANDPSAVIVFNGQFYPEASAAWAARRRGIRVISHEVGLMPFTAYFTPGEATAYPIDIPANFELSLSQNTRLDAYLSKRFQGDFSMAGIRFWQDIRGLDDGFLDLASKFKQIVPIFTNVIFDTSQGHANTLFTDMFAWLDALLPLMRAHTDTLFVIRAHPDEKRPGKESRETVADWVRSNGCDQFPNVLFVDSTEPFSSYDLIRRSKFVLFYNSTIGLEASIMGMPVLGGGKARFTQVDSVFFPANTSDYIKKAEEFLTAESVKTPAEHQRNARRFLYFQIFRSSLPFDDFLEEDRFWKGYVTLRPFEIDALRRKNSPTLDTILRGILEKGDFLLPE